MMRVKICGITNEADALAAAAAGADAVGFVLAESPRRITPKQAGAIARALPPLVTPVLVLVNESVASVWGLVELTGVRTVQLSGDETPRDVAALKRRLKVLKAVRLATSDDVERMGRYDADAFVVDAAAGARYGGTGELADWALAREAARRHRVILAGGLNPENVVGAVEQVAPFGVDVSSGVEADPGRKDEALVRAFVSRARGALHGC